MNDVTFEDVTIIRETIDWSPRFITTLIEAEAVGSRYDICATWDRRERRLVVALVNFRSSSRRVAHRLTPPAPGPTGGR